MLKKNEETAVRTINLTDEKESNPAMNDYQNRRLMSPNINANVNLNVRNYNEHESNLNKKVVIRPSSAKYEPRSKTPGVVINSSNSNVRREIAMGVNRPSSGYSAISNNNPVSIQSSNNRILKPSPSSNYISPIPSKNIISTGVSTSICHKM